MHRMTAVVDCALVLVPVAVARPRSGTLAADAAEKLVDFGLENGLNQLADFSRQTASKAIRKSSCDGFGNSRQLGVNFLHGVSPVGVVTLELCCFISRHPRRSARPCAAGCSAIKSESHR